MRRLCRTQIAITLLFVSLFVCASIQSAEKAEITSTIKSKFTADEIRLPGKKGACFTLRETGKPGSAEKNIPKIKALNVYWNYSWGSTISDKQPADIEFVPMVWGAWGPPEELAGKLRKNLYPDIEKGRIKRVLGFNEPDKENQANMPYMKAIEYWPALMSLNVPLCSPACANPEGSKNDESTQGVPGTWMRDFMQEVDARGYRVDYIGVHWYGGTSARHFKNKMRRIYEKYGRRPLLITEFAPADWNTKGDHAKNGRPVAQVLAFAKEVLPWMEAQEWIAGYTWYSFPMRSANGYTSALFYDDGNLTALGKYYASVTTENPQGDQSIRPDDAELHLKKALEAAKKQ